MELRQLRYFVAVAEELHFRRAAERLHLSQPPLSHQIAALEAELECQLLARTRRRVSLTPAGVAFLRDARSILSALEGATEHARAIAAGQLGTVRVSFVGSALVSSVPAMVQRFRAGRPHVRVQLRERSTTDQLQSLARGAIDVGLVRPPIDPDGDLESRVLSTEPTVIAMAVDHPLARARRVTLAQAARQSLVLFPREQAPGFHDLLTGALADSSAAPLKIAQYAPEMLTIIGLVAAGIGVSPVPATLAKLALEGVTYRPLIGAPKSELLILRRAQDDSALSRAFVDEALATVRAATQNTIARPSRSSR